MNLQPEPQPLHSPQSPQSVIQSPSMLLNNNNNSAIINTNNNAIINNSNVNINNTNNNNEHPHYTKIRILGSGSFGKVYLVTQNDTNIDEYYVIKQIELSDMTQIQRNNVMQQAKIMKMLDHPNIIKLKQMFISNINTINQKLNIVMEYASGGDLSHRIKLAKNNGNQYFHEETLLSWFTQICLGIKHMHDRKITHRDIKGQNIFLMEDQCVKIGDLGVARVMQHTMAKAKTVVGSPYYLSPQIIENRPYSSKTDIWSLGVLLYQLCALTPPFTANNLQFLALKIVRGNFTPLPSQYSQDLRNLIKSMLNLNPNNRPTINQILSSPLINRRIKSLLTQSQNVREFSHTVMHGYDVRKGLVVDRIRPPPNLMEIQLQGKREIQREREEEIMMENYSALVHGGQIQQNNNISKAKTPHCIGKNAPPLKKKQPNPVSNKRPSTAQNLSQLIKIKSTPLQHHIIPQKLPTPKIPVPVVNPNPVNLMKKRPETSKTNVTANVNNYKQIKSEQYKHQCQSEKIVGNNSQLSNEKGCDGEQIKNNISDVKVQGANVISGINKNKNTNKNSTNIAFHKKKSIDCTQYNKQHKPSMKKIQKQQQQHQQKYPQQCMIDNPSVQQNYKSEPSIPSSPTKQQSQPQQNIHTNIIVKKQPQGSNTNNNANKIKLQIKPVSSAGSNKITTAGTGTKAVVTGQKGKVVSNNNSKNKGSANKQKQKDKQKEKQKQKQKQKCDMKFELVSQQLKSKQKSTKQVTKKQSKKVPGTLKKGKTTSRKQQKQQNQLQQQQVNHEQIQIVQQQKCNDASQGLYSNQDFQSYQNGDNGNTQGKELDRDSQLSFQLSNSSLQEIDSKVQNNNNNNKNSTNYQKVLAQLQIINKLVDQAKGNIQNLPILGHSIPQLLQLSLQPPQLRNTNFSTQSNMPSNTNLNITNISSTKSQAQQYLLQTQQKQQQQPDNLNLACFGDQSELQNLRMALQEIFGIHNIITIYQYMTNIIEKEGLDFQEEEVIRQLLHINKQGNNKNKDIQGKYQGEGIDQGCLRRHFRMIVTVIVVENQVYKDNAQ